jgi:antitoxin component YwqK of YwqJK toxin-antitoxin module
MNRCTLALVVTGLLVAIAEPQVFRGYSTDGTLEFQATKEKNRRVVRGYHPNGSLQFVATYKRGKLDGVTREYYRGDSLKVGPLKSEVRYENNRRHGEARFYSPNGMIMAMIHYLHNKEVGTSEFYDENGMLASTLSHKNRTRARVDEILSQDSVSSAPAPVHTQ